MPDFSRKRLAQYRIEKAETCYTAAKNLAEDGLYEDSANRSYYAIFHAVRAVLALDSVDFKKHSAVISYFQQHFVKTGLFDRMYSDIVRDAFSIRQDCDYEDFFVISNEETIEQVKNSRFMIDAAKRYIETAAE